MPGKSKGFGSDDVEQFVAGEFGSCATVGTSLSRSNVSTGVGRVLPTAGVKEDPYGFIQVRVETVGRRASSSRNWP